jgi:hypothetical protein
MPKKKIIVRIIANPPADSKKFERELVSIKPDEGVV